MRTEPGLRERKKQRTRQLITDAAAGLFAAHGFENVTVADVAHAVDLSVATVFNYFRTKEDLVFGGMAEFEGALLRALRDRPPGTALLDALADFVAHPLGLVAADDPDAIDKLAAAARLTANSAALRAREAQLFDDHTGTLAELVAAETGAAPDDIRPWVAANAIIGLYRALKDYIHREVLAGTRGPDLRAAVIERSDQALTLLRHGLADYLTAHP